MLNTIFLRRKNKIAIVSKNFKNTKALLATLLKNISSLGYTFSKEIIDILKTYDKKALETFQKSILKTLENLLGAKYKFEPMYPNFPKQVMEASDAELYLNAILHYLTYGKWTPNYETKKRPALKDSITLKVIELGTTSEFRSIVSNIISSKVAVSPQDKEDVEWFVKQFRAQIDLILPEKIENKENLSYFLGILKTHNLITDEVISKYFRTATDVLRYITALSEGDVSLVENTRYKNFPRSDRRLFLNMIENCSNIAEDMLRHDSKWIRVGEKLHPSEYKSRYPKTNKAFNAIRNNLEIKTFANQFEKLIKEGKSKEVAKLAGLRPGEFARRLDWILRTCTRGHKTILDTFEGVSSKVSSTVLLQLGEYFKNRNVNKYRVFLPKGSISKIMLLDNDLPQIKEESCKRVVKICNKALVKQFSTKEKLTSVYIDEDLKNYTVPFALRSASKSLRTVSRGSKITLEEGSTIRLFLHWKNISSGDRVDVDLSAMFYNEGWEYMEHISYTNLNSDNYKSCHSGDITDAPDGASEFIDVDIKSALKHKARYIVMNVISFTGQKFIEIPECFAGAMIRDKVQSGKIYDPSTVKDKFDLTSESNFNVPLIFDLLERKIIWVDSAIKSNTYHFGRNVESNQTGITALGKAFTSISKPNLYDLFKLHAKARKAKLVTKSKAKTIFSVDEGVTPFDIEEIVGQYL